MLALAPPLIAALLQSLLWHWFSPYVWLLFYPAVFLCSTIGGKKGGILGTFLSVAMVGLLFLPKVFVAGSNTFGTLGSSAVFVSTGLLFSLLNEKLQQTNKQLTTALASVRTLNEDLESKVNQRTLELRQLMESLRDSHAKTDAALASMTDAVFISDTDGQFSQFNDAFATFHRFKNKDECARKLSDYPDIIQVFFPNGEESPLDMWAVPRALRGETVTNAEYVIRRRDTGETWVGSYNFGPVRDQHGVIVGSVVVGRDITDRKREEEEIRLLNAKLEMRIDDRTRQLETAIKELDAFTYSVSHDLRAPLRHVDGFIELLVKASDGQLSDKCLGYLNTIQSASQEMGHLIDDLLAFSRTGKVELRQRHVSLDGLVNECVEVLKFESPNRDITWRVDSMPQAIGDPTLLKQVFLNLMRNAVKYTSKREKALIEVGTTGEEDGRTVVYVRDNGVGFDMQYVGKLFGVFQRLHRVEDFEGTGIGLAIVRNIITRHGGRVWAAGELGEGATFYFTLSPVEIGI